MDQRYYEEKLDLYNQPGKFIKVLKSKKIKNPNQLEKNGPKLSCFLTTELYPDDFQFLKQLGINYCYCWFKREQLSRELVLNLKLQLEKEGIKIYKVANREICKNTDIIFGTEKRDQNIEFFVQFLHLLYDCEFKFTIFTLEAKGVFNTHLQQIRGGEWSRSVDQNLLTNSSKKICCNKYLWNNLYYFINRILPIMERLGISLGIHPNDPPLENINGIPCLICSYEAYENLFFKFKSYNCLGMEFCCGCWLEGGEKFGFLVEKLQKYIQARKIFTIHLRNVTCSLPIFNETYLDEGYGNIFKIIKILVENYYNGSIILDHSPPMVIEGNDSAFSLGYIKASIRAAQNLN